VDSGSHLRVRGEGEAGPAGNGDLYVIIEVKPHAVFQRHNNDILTEASVSLSKAILGAEIEVPTLHGKAKMKIPPGTQSHTVFRLKEKGVPDLHSNSIGDELVKVNVEIPGRLNAQQRRIIEDFARASGEETNDGSGFTDKIKKVFR
jgi:molecular chaperone DnaJ